MKLSARRNRFAPLFEPLCAVDQLVESMYDACCALTTAWPAIDVHDTEDALVLTLDVPGIRTEDLNVTFEEDKLTIAGERKKTSDKRYVIRERARGPFRRTIKVSVPVDGNGIRAETENGVLTITLPKAENARPRKIKVKAA